MKNKLINSMIMAVTALLLSVPQTLWSKSTGDLNVMVKIQGNSPMPSQGSTGTDILVYKKDSGELLAHKRETRVNDGRILEIPFGFENLPEGELEVKVYSSTFLDSQSKHVDLKTLYVTNRKKPVKVTLELSRVQD